MSVVAPTPNPTMYIKLNDANHTVANPLAIATLTAPVDRATVLLINGVTILYETEAKRNRDFIALSDKMAGS